MKYVLLIFIALATFSPLAAFADSDQDISPVLCVGDGVQVWAGHGLVDGEKRGRTTNIDGSDKAVYQDVEAHLLQPVDGVDRFEVKFGGKSYTVHCSDVSIEI